MVDFHYWQWNLSHKQVYGSDTESNVTLKVTRVGRFSLYVTVAVTAIQLTPHAHLIPFTQTAEWTYLDPT